MVTDDTRAAWCRVWAEQSLQDLRYTLRTLRRNPGFAAVVILTLAIAIGMNTAIFSVFNAVVLRPLAYPHPDRLVWLATAGADEEFGIVSGPEFHDWRESAASFDRMVAYVNGDYTLTSPQGAARVRAAMVTQDFWELSGARPAAGRLPGPQELGVVLLSHRFAQRSFAGDADVIGRTVTLDGEQVTIVGVLPEPFRFQLPGSPWVGPRPRDIDVYLPLAVSSARSGPVALLSVVARLKDGASLATGQAEIEAIRTRVARAHPNPLQDHRTLRVVPLHDQLIGRAGPALLVLLGAVVFVLLIACANAANLLLARASVRQKEIAVRMSVGAGRGRVLRQLLVESLVIAALGSTAGLLLARLGVAAILRIDSLAIPRLAETTIDGRVLFAVLATAVLTALVFGLAPAVAVWKMDPHDAIKSGAQTASPAAASVRIRRALVAGEVALALMLLIGAGLMLKSAWRMTAHSPGFEPQRVVIAEMQFSGPHYSEPHRRSAFADALLGRLQTDPGAEAASISTHGYMLTESVTVEGEPAPTPEERARKAPIMINATTPALRHVMGFHVVRGRWFSEGEAAAVLNETVARRDFSGRDPIGLGIRLSEGGPVLTIVGIVADLKYSKLDAPAEPEVYAPYARVEDSLFGFTVLALARHDAREVAASLRKSISEIGNTQVPDEVLTLEQALAKSIAPRRLNLVLFGTFAAAALFLALVGIYGVMAYAVSQRVHEIGVRMALGAQRADVLRMVVRQGMSLTVAGILAGVAGASALTRLMDSLLYEVEPTDPLTFAMVTTVLATTGLCACSLPAVKAALVDPVVALRDE